jgi:hypothetical protein
LNPVFLPKHLVNFVLPYPLLNDLNNHPAHSTRDSTVVLKMPSSSSKDNSGHSDTNTKQSRAARNTMLYAFQIELELTISPLKPNLDNIRKLIDAYGAKVRQLRAKLPSYPDGLLLLQEAGLYAQSEDRQYAEAIRGAYKVRLESKRQTLEHIARLEDRKARLEDVLMCRDDFEKFRAKMRTIIQDDTKFSL